ncbi:DNA polymerase eta subunit, partial [Pseudohyphozyma bogoriensis]
VSLDYYRRESVKILKVFKEVEGAIVEKASIDESYLYLTTPVIAAILSRYPSLSKPPSTSTSSSTSQGLDTPLPSPASMGIRIPWSEVGNIIPVRRAPAAEGEDESQAEEEVESEVTWHDVALWIGAEMVAKCRAGVQARLGYTCSAGIAGNKMLAKLCSAWKKPNAQTVLRTAAVAGFLNPFPFQKIRNLGGKLGNQVAETWKAESVGELLGIDLKEFQRELGEENGKWVWEVIRGGEWGEVEEKTLVKSMLSSKYHWIHVLSTELYGRLADARAEAEIWPKTLTFHYRTLNYTVRSHQLPFPYTSNLTIAYIDNLAQRLVKAALPPKLVPTETVGPWNNFSLGFEGLERGEKGQAGIQSFFSAGQVETEAGGKAEGKRKAEEVVILSSEDGGGTGGAGDAEKEEEQRERKRRKKEERLAAAAPSKAKAAAAPSTFSCERCAKPVSIPTGQDLDKARAEHADYHVARDLLEGERMAMRGPPKPLAAASTVGKESGTGPTGGGKKSAKKTGEEGRRAKGQSSLTGFFGRK